MTRKLDGRYEIRVKKGQTRFLTPDLVRWVSDHTGLVSFLKSSFEASNTEGKPCKATLVINGKKTYYSG